MSPEPQHVIVHHRDPLARMLGGAALLAALVGMVFAMSGVSNADRAAKEPAGIAAKAKPKKAKAKKKKLPGASTKPKPYGILRLSKGKHFPAAVIPRVDRAKRADTLAGVTRQDLALNCPANTADMGTWCILSATFPVPKEDLGRNDFAYATKTCADLGGYLPTAAQLFGAADKVKLSGSIDDNPTTAAIDQDPSDGLKDSREMSATLVTTTAGSTAAGTQGPSPGSKGDPKQGEPDPIPLPADPLPDTLQYVTVYDNRNQGGFAGSAPVAKPEKFRCAFDKQQGEVAAEG